jgi:hypothetical protein
MMNETPGGTKITSALRTSTLVHEARHSDCTGGMDSDDVGRIRAGGMPASTECFYRHVDCPKGHPMAGLEACDEIAWGAYTMGALFSAALAKNCTNCSEEEKQQALMVTMDGFSRVLVLEAMMKGQLGDPDMSSSSEVRQKDPEVNAVVSAIHSERSAGNTKPATIEAE